MTYPTCPRCDKGRMIPMLMSGPACDLACERKPIGRVGAKEISFGGISASSIAGWTRYGITQPAPVAPVANKYAVVCFAGNPNQYVRFVRPYGGKKIKRGDVLSLEYSDGSVEYFIVDGAGLGGVVAQNGTSNFDDGRPATLVVPA